MTTTQLAAAVLCATLVASCATSKARDDAMVDDVSPDANNDDPPAACEPGRAFVTHHLAPTGDCTLDLDSSVIIPIGVYDVAGGGSAESDRCDQPYNLNLLVNSCVDDVLQIHSAQITLRDVARARIVFNRNEVPLPNPFLVTANTSLFPSDTSEPSTSIAAVETIPSAYAAQLDGFVGRELLAEVQVFGTTQRDVDVDVEPFLYRIKICSGCLQQCASSLADGVALDEVYGEDTCQDNAGADGRVCIDNDC